MTFDPSQVPNPVSGISTPPPSDALSSNQADRVAQAAQSVQAMQQPPSAAPAPAPNKHELLGRIVSHIKHAVEGRETVYSSDPSTGTVVESTQPRKPGGIFRDLVGGMLAGLAASTTAGIEHPSGANGLALGFTGARADQQAQQDRARQRAQQTATSGFQRKQVLDQQQLAAAQVAHDTVNSLNIGHFVPHFSDEEISDYNGSVNSVRKILMDNGGQMAEVQGNGEKGNGPALMKAYNSDPSLMIAPEGMHRVASIVYDTDGLKHLGHQWVSQGGGQLSPDEWNKRGTVYLTDVPNSVWNKNVSLDGRTIQDVAPGSSLVKDPKKTYSTSIGSIFALGLRNKQDMINARNELYRAPQNEQEALALKAEADQINSDPDAPADLKRRAAIKGPLADKFLQGLDAQKAAQRTPPKAPTNVGEARAAVDSATFMYRDNPSQENARAVKDAQTRLTNLRKDVSDKKLEDARAKKVLDEGDEDIVARALASGDPTSIKDVTSMRSDQRLRVFAKAKRINPDFNTTTAKLKADTLEKYTNGKQADQIQSFGTFLGHAADASDVVNNYRTTASPLINKPLNWIRKNVAGDPGYSQFVTALAPVRDEFMTFLQNNHALTESDKKSADIIMSDDSSPAQIQGALKQMSNTAFIRLGELNSRYKRVMGEDFPDLLDEDAVQAANKLGMGAQASRYRTGGRVTGAAARPQVQPPPGATQEAVDGNGDVVGHVVNGVYVPLRRGQ